MFKKVLVVEDLDSIGYGIAVMLKQELGVGEVVLSQYCGDAYLKFMRSVKEQEAFDLLITDLSFNEDHREDKIANGKQLIKKIRALGHKTPIIVCSVEEKPAAVKKLFQSQDISGYVVKGRSGLKNLLKAVESVQTGGTYLSPQLSGAIRQRGIFEVEDYDVRLLSHLSNGLTQDEIARYFDQNGISPSSLSSIEKRLNRLKDELRAKNTIQLVANAKDLGLI
ncbi:response regulator [Flagellimonas aquimarina]|uniref:Response regulator n=1 Tax=Flagellimonas aquimarina TaxID=2201895 RepID=A0A316KX07_9FLAO|nr:response regulator [Allomuricauda koreensis]PWL38111.1 response regulator [Allomuricauda koreensis]